MESFGAYIRSLREEKRISLEEISVRTKIALPNLELLEADRYDLLPPRVFVKGFIKSYVQELGLNPEEVIRRFEAFTAEGEVPDYEPDDHPLFHHKSPREPFVGSTVFNIVLTGAGFVAFCILVLTGVTRFILPEEKADKSGTVKVTTSQAPSAASPLSDSEESQEDSQSSNPDQPPDLTGRKVLQIKATHMVWVRVEPDSGPAQEITMTPGEVKEFTANRAFHLQTVNAGAIRLRYDGREQSVPGRLNQALCLSLPMK